MSKKKDKKKENLLAETVEMQKKQAMNLVAQSTVNQQLLEEVIGIKEEMDRNVKKTNQKLTDIELLVEEVNKKVHIDDGEASKIEFLLERHPSKPAQNLISDELFDDLRDYLSTNYTRGKTTKPVLDKINAGLPEELFKQFQEEVEALRKEHPNGLNNYIRYVKDCDQKNANKTQNAINQCYLEKAALTPLKAIQMEGVLSRELFSKIVDCVFNHYEWPERLDDEIGRIILKYRKKGELGRNKITVRKALYKAYALDV